MFIDGVFSGGGIKGFALIGAYEAVEEKGLKFKRLAGTSAGSIIASLITAGYTSTEVKTIIDEVDLTKFLDPRRTKLPIPFAKWLLIYWRLGLYKGEALEEWIASKLAAKGIKTFNDLPENGLRLIASDLTHGKMLVLPNDLIYYGIDPMSFSVAKAVRMSCSIPYFFEPVKLRPATGKSLIVDGGVLSNFPIWLFDNENRNRTRPVLGVKLSGNEANLPSNTISNAIGLFSALFETMMKAHDLRYISREHEKNIVFIPTDSGLSIEFEITPEKKQALIELGKERTGQFLANWCY